MEISLFVLSSLFCGMLLQDDSTVGVLQFLEPFWVSDGVNLIERVRKINEDYYFFQGVS